MIALREVAAGESSLTGDDFETPGEAGRSALVQILAQQAAIAEISQHALGERRLDVLLADTCSLVARILGTKLVSVLELAPDRRSLKLIAGVGWRPGIVGQFVVPASTGSQSGFMLATGSPIIVADLETERRFDVAPMLAEHGAVSGISVRIGDPSSPFGALNAFTNRRGRFTRDDLRFLEAVAGVIASAIGRLRAEDELRKSRDELAGILASVSEGITVQDGSGALLYANDAAAQLSGFTTAAEMLASSSADILARFELLEDDGSPMPVDRLPGREVLATGRRAAPLLVRHKVKETGEERWSNVQASPIVDEEGKVTHVVSVFRDVTKEKLAEETHALREAFLGVMSHELRTPITTIYGGMELLAHGLDGERRAEVIRDVRAESGRLVRLVEDLLIMTRVERGVLEMADEPLLLQRLLPSVVAGLEPAWPTLAVELQVGERLPAVRGDVTYIEQVVRNLLINAIRYGDGLEKGVRVVVETAQDEVVVRVLDSGPGLGGSEPEQLFDLFFRAPTARAVSGGAGIGLYVCRALVEAMGGRIWAQQRESGSEFGFALQMIETD